LRRCRQRLQEEEEVKQGLQSSSFPKRVAQTAMPFVSSMFSGGNDDEVRGPTAVRRFERFADGATEFLRYVELGGTPCRYMFYVPLIRHLLAGTGTKYCFVHGGQHLSLILQPFSPPNRGMEGALIFLIILIILNHCFFNYWILIDEGTYTQYRINQNDEARDCGRAKIPSAMSHGVVLHRHADDPSLSSCRFQSRQPGGCSWGASSAAKIARGKINARASATPPHLSNLRAAPGAGVWATKRRKGATKRRKGMSSEI
jgi:hypothetical protein